MNTTIKERITVFSILFAEAIVLAAFFIGMDKDVNGIENAFSSQFIFYVVTFGFFWSFPLVCVYASYRYHSLKQGFMMLLFIGFILGGILSLGGGAGDYNRFLYFFIRSGFMMGVVGVSVAIAVLASKAVLISSKNLKST